MFTVQQYFFQYNEKFGHFDFVDQVKMRFIFHFDHVRLKSIHQEK